MLILVIGVLAMLFIIGSTLIIVARFERQTADKLTSGQNMDAILQAMMEPIQSQLREDVVGNTGIPYSRAWNTVVETSQIEDSADFPGLTTDYATPGGMVRSGDLLTSAVEPWYNPTTWTETLPPWPAHTYKGGKWYLPSPSWLIDAPLTGGQPSDLYTLRNIEVSLTSGPSRDADGDGILDSLDPLLLQTTTSMFGNAYRAQIRVVPHGGMVLIDPFTHPLLLAQVIHPEDVQNGINYHNDPMQLWATDSLALSAADESRIRRRFMLPADLGLGMIATGKAVLPSNLSDLRTKLPVTLGYWAPSNAPAAVTDLTPHWWPADDTMVRTSTYTDNDWWQLRLTPPAKALTEGYTVTDAATDTYDRRHLITTFSSDDMLRVNRDEGRLYDKLGVAPYNDTLGPGGTDSVTSIYDLYAQLYRALNADAAGGTDTYGLSKFPVYAYGREPVAGTLAFNVDGLRTPFSLRDTLGVTWNSTASTYEYDVGSAVVAPPIKTLTGTRALQLTAYFLAMMQHSSVPGSDGPTPTRPTPTEAELVEQLKTAAQLAVNAIDFADADNVPTCLTFNWSDPSTTPPTPKRLQVFGYEKQPFLTEAYAKVVQKAASASAWEPAIQPDSIFAVELYNPYPNPLVLDGYRIRMNAGSTEVSLDGIAIPGYSYIVLANGSDDTLLAQTPFLSNASDTGANQNFFYPGSPAGSKKYTLTKGTSFEFQPAPDPIRLVRTTTWDVSNIAADAVAGPEVEVDRLETTETRWAERDVTPPKARTPNDGTDILVRDTSLQRHKEYQGVDIGGGRIVYPPVFWHFTLSQQVVMPPPEYDQTLVPAPGATPPTTTALSTDKYRPAQHSLLLSDRMFIGTAGRVPDPPIPSPMYMPNYKVAETYFLRTALANWKPFLSPPGMNKPQYDQVVVINNINTSEPPLAPLQLVTSDRGVDANTGGTLAFPTTGSLLLVPRYAHEVVYTWNASPTPPDPPDWNPPTFVPMSVAATRGVWLDNPNQTIPPPPAVSMPQMQMVDNGHLPVFDINQLCRDLTNPQHVAPDGPQGRLSAPWGQLAYEYFTALPLDELFRPMKKSLVATFGVPPLDATFGYPLADTQHVPSAAYEQAYRNLFTLYPLVDRVDGAKQEKGSVIGPKVRGRININEAPWWVLDGLPVLPDGYPGTLDAIPQNSPSPLAGVPVTEVLSGLAGLSGFYGVLDPPAYLNPSSAHSPAATLLLGPSANGPTLAANQKPLFDPGAPGGAPSITDWFPSVSPTFAKYLVSYREDRQFDATINAQNNLPGFVSVGQLASVIAPDPVNTPLLGYPVTVKTLGDNGTTTNLTHPLAWFRPYSYLADSNDPNSGQKPYAYLGYLQFVAPLVRIEDWVTVRNHVFTIYATVGDTSDRQMPLWMRTQMTVDRTACLYKSNELPQKITETPPIAYQNAVDDK